MTTLTPNGNLANKPCKRISGANLDISDKDYLRVEQCRPDNLGDRLLLNKRLTAIATACAVTFDGYDEDGFPCFITLED